MGGDNVRSPLVKIGLTDLPKTGGLKPPPPGDNPAKQTSPEIYRLKSYQISLDALKCVML